jgi:hypothetical protein
VFNDRDTDDGSVVLSFAIADRLGVARQFIG